MTPERRWDAAPETYRQGVLQKQGIEAWRAESLSYASWTALPADVRKLWEKYFKK